MASLFDSVKPTDIERLIELFAKNEEFTSFIADDAIDPFRTTSFMPKVIILDNIFRNVLKDKDIEDIKLSDFESDEADALLNQLPNLLKTYVIKTDYEFGNNKSSDENFCYLIFRIIETERVYKSFKTFESAFLKAAALRYTYKKFEAKLKEFILNDPEFQDD